MNKVAKEQLGLFKPKKIEIPEFNLESRDYLHSVLAQHEQNSFIKFHGIYDKLLESYSYFLTYFLNYSTDLILAQHPFYS